MSLRQDVQALLKGIGPGKMTSTAYDTAWVGRLAEFGEPMGEQALEWLREHQLPDGTWGAVEPRYYHDRLMCTLAAATALARQRDTRDRARLQRAQLGLDIAHKGLRADPVGETVGFEMIVPTLLVEAKALGVIQRGVTGLLRRSDNLYQAAVKELSARNSDRQYRDEDYLAWMVNRRKAKLESLPAGKVNRYVTVAFSAEMAGTDGLKLFDVENLQEANGSVGHSPAATAYFALYVRPQDPAALSYLRQVSASNGGAIPDLAPFDVFERAWVLWNLALAGPLDEDTLALCRPHLDFLWSAWQSGLGVGLSIGYTPKDGDDTSLTFDVLMQYGRKVDVYTLLQYEDEEHFRCYRIEANPSPTVNIHMLGALRLAGLEVEHPSVQKIIRYLKNTQLMEMLWLDKWHVSPYYPTTHAIIAASGDLNNFAVDAIHWILDTQNADGSWGYYIPTAEETAYCLQALFIWKRNGGHVPSTVLKRGLTWLGNHCDPPYPPLWIGKGLYCPVMVVRSALLSAMMFGVQEGFVK